MRKISELTSDEFFDVIFALSPILPLITDMEIVQVKLFGNNKEMTNKEVTELFARDITKIIPLLTSKERRSCIFEIISIVDGIPIDEVKLYPPSKTATKIKKIISDADFKDFLSYADKSELTE